MTLRFSHFLPPMLAALAMAVAAAAPAGSAIAAGRVTAAAFGAVPDDGRVDGAALQAAIDRLAASGGGTLSLPKGRFVLERSLYLRSGVAVVGAGAATVLTTEGGSPAPHWRATAVFAGNMMAPSFAENGGRGYAPLPVAGWSERTLRLGDCRGRSLPEAGDVVWIASADGYAGAGGFLRPDWGRITAVTERRGCRIVLADPLDAPAGTALTLGHADGSITDPGREPILPIANARLANLAIDSALGNGLLVSGCYRCSFENLVFGRTQRFLALQAVRHVEVRNVSGTFSRRGIEFAMLASDTRVAGIKARFEPGATVDRLRPAVRFGENAEGNSVSDGEFLLAGADGGMALVQFLRSQNNAVRSVDFRREGGGKRPAGPTVVDSEPEDRGGLTCGNIVADSFLIERGARTALASPEGACPGR
ncbi:MAG: glycosyl hydrolase family 28-related protein [Hyphomicrobiales bacterium]